MAAYADLTTDEQRVKFAIYATMLACSHLGFVGWANAWYSGADRTLEGVSFSVPLLAPIPIRPGIDAGALAADYCFITARQFAFETLDPGNLNLPDSLSYFAKETAWRVTQENPAAESQFSGIIDVILAGG